MTRNEPYKGLGFIFLNRIYSSIGYMTPSFRVHVATRGLEPRRISLCLKRGGSP